MKANLIFVGSDEKIFFSIAGPCFAINCAVLSMIARISGGGIIIPTIPFILLSIYKNRAKQKWNTTETIRITNWKSNSESSHGRSPQTGLCIKSGVCVHRQNFVSISVMTTWESFIAIANFLGSVVCRECSLLADSPKNCIRQFSYSKQIHCRCWSYSWNSWGLCCFRISVFIFRFVFYYPL